MTDTSFTGLSTGRDEPTLDTRLQQSVAHASLQSQPFEYIYMEELFAPDFFREMLAQMPAEHQFRALRHKDAMRADGSSTRLRMYLWPEHLWKLPQRKRAVWSEVSRVLRSRALQEAFLDKFSRSLEARFGRPTRSLSFFPIPILLCDRPGYRIGIHADATTKAITVQFYLPPDASRRHLGTVFHEGRAGEAAARTKSLAYVPASGYAFPVMPKESWHSVPQTSDADGDRYSLMLIYYVQDTPAKWLKQRYDRLRCLFGVGPKG
jgi:hypothetical protein